MEVARSRRAGVSLPFGVFAGVLLVRLIVLARMADSPFLVPSQGDMWFYNDWARRILLGQHDTAHAFYGLPLYPYLLAACYYCFGFNPFVPGLLQACADAGTALLVYKIAVRLFESRGAVAASLVGIFAAAGWAFFQPAQAYAVVLMPTALAIFVFWFVVWQLLRREQLPSCQWFLGIAVMIGFSAMAVATILFLIPLITAACIWKWPPPSGSRLLAERSGLIALLFAGVAIGSSPCFVHNYFLAHDPVLLSAHSGVNFWIGNNPTANGYPNFPPGLHAGQESMLRDSITAAEKAAGHPLKRSEVSAYWRRQANGYIRQHPGEWLGLMVRKMGNFWSAFQYDDLSIITILRQDGILTPGIRYGLVAAFAVAGVVLAFRNHPQARWVVVALALHMCALLPVFVTERYRLPAVPGLLVFAAYAAWFFADCCQHLRLPALAGFALLLGGATCLVAQPQKDPSLWALDAYNAGIVALDLHKTDLARRQLELAYDYSPDNAEVNFALGNLNLECGDKQRAKAYYQTAVSLDPRHDRALNNLGVLALAEERWQLAEHFFRLSLAQNSADATTHFLIAKTLLAQGETAPARVEAERALALEPSQPEFGELCRAIGR